jgi:hypothetical protein
MPQVCGENFFGIFQVLIIFSVLSFGFFFLLLALYPMEELLKPIDWFLIKVTLCYRKV